MTQGEVIGLIKAFGGSSGGGGGSSAFVVEVTGGVCNKTASEIMAASKQGVVVFSITDDLDYSDYNFILNSSAYGSEWGYEFITVNYTFKAANGTDYPSIQE